VSRIVIDRFVLTIDGVSSEVAQEALADLAAELRRRLGSRRLDENTLSNSFPSAPVKIEAHGSLDAASLRAAIADGVWGLLTSGALQPLERD
jgi:hypothetical protein